MYVQLVIKRDCRLQKNTKHSGIIVRFEILKMASKMAVGKAPKTYMTNMVDVKQFDFDFLWMFRG